MRAKFPRFLLLIFLISCISLDNAKAQPAGKEIVVGDTMPAFSLADQNGKTFNSADYTGKSYLVIYFYPKDESMVCTKEACRFRDSFNDFTKAGAKVIGINAGAVASHRAFADHYNQRGRFFSFWRETGWA